MTLYITRKLSVAEGFQALNPWPYFRVYGAAEVDDQLQLTQFVFTLANRCAIEESVANQLSE